MKFRWKTGAGAGPFTPYIKIKVGRWVDFHTDFLVWELTDKVLSAYTVRSMFQLLPKCGCLWQVLESREVWRQWFIFHQNFTSILCTSVYQNQDLSDRKSRGLCSSFKNAPINLSPACYLKLFAKLFVFHLGEGPLSSLLRPAKTR